MWSWDVIFAPFSEKSSVLANPNGFSRMKIPYSYLPNKRGGPNKQGGWKLFWKSINGEGENVPNKRGGWKCSSNSINGEK